MTIDVGLFVTTIVSSAVVAALVSALADYLMRRFDYRNEYYKQLIGRRLEAYEAVEAVIFILKSVVYDEVDKKISHIIFHAGAKKYVEDQAILAGAIAKGIWLSQQTSDLLSDLNFVFSGFSAFENESELIVYGKKNYEAIRDIRNKLENSVKKDLLDLYDMKSFLKIGKQDKAIPVEKVFGPPR